MSELEEILANHIHGANTSKTKAAIIEWARKRVEARIPERYKGEYISNPNSEYVRGWNACGKATLKNLSESE